MNYTQKEIARRIRGQRELNGYTREALEEVSGISVRFLFDIEKGKKDITTDTLIMLCNALNTTPNYILLGDDSESEYMLSSFCQLDSKQKQFANDFLELMVKYKDK